MDFFEVTHTQRAIRRFKPDPVPEQDLWRMLDAAIRAPSGSNTQPWAWVVVQEADRRQAIAAAVRGALEQSGRLAEIHRDAKEAKDPARRRMLEGSAGFLENVAAAPVLVIPCLTQSSSPDYDVRSLLAGASIYGAVQNLMLAGRALGVGSVLTTFNRFMESALREELDLPEHVVPACVIPMGYPEGQRFGPTTRKPVESVTFWDRWGSQRNRPEPPRGAPRTHDAVELSQRPPVGP